MGASHRSCRPQEAEGAVFQLQSSHNDRMAKNIDNSNKNKIIMIIIIGIIVTLHQPFEGWANRLGCFWCATQAKQCLGQVYFLRHLRQRIGERVPHLTPRGQPGLMAGSRCEGQSPQPQKAPNSENHSVTALQGWSKWVVLVARGH